VTSSDGTQTAQAVDTSKVQITQITAFIPSNNQKTARVQKFFPLRYKIW